MHGKQDNPSYQVIARKYRPQRFVDVYGQEALVTLLKNGIRSSRIAHAYLFSGPRGTGKTTLARLFAKALNCSELSSDCEPCNHCSSCKEITNSHSLDVIEIDGASNRGIDEIRQINETVSYAAASGGYKIYIIDEVHMLTKEAFNALLKTLEEPPANVIFIFATTEPHKVLPTILSRCQRLNLRSLTPQLIHEKLTKIAKDLNRTVDEEVLRMVSRRAEGGLRDAESLFDQLLAFFDGHLSSKEASQLLGSVPQELFFALDQAGKEGQLAFAFQIASQIFSEGKDIAFFIQNLTEHFRRHLLCKLTGIENPLLEISAEEKIGYLKSTSYYLKEQLLNLLELCLEAETAIRHSPVPRMSLEGLLLKILRSHNQIPLDHLVQRLFDLEKTLQANPTSIATVSSPPPPSIETPKDSIQQEVKKEVIKEPVLENKVKKPEAVPSQPPPSPKMPLTKPSETVASLISSPRYDTVLQFAAIELEGKIIRKG